MKLDVQGHTAYAYTGGKPFDAALPCVVFVHGACHDHTAFALHARWFAHHGYAVLAVDLPGHSRSEGPPLADVEAMADWVLALLGAAGVERAAFVGHSMGSLIALEAASRAAERADALVMLGTAFPMKVSDALLSTARDAPGRAMAMVNAWSISGFASKPGLPGPGNWLHGSNLVLMHRVQASQPGSNVFLQDFEACNRYAGGLDAAARVRCPVHFILGCSDQMTPLPATKALQAALQPRIHTVPSGHHQMGETPEATLAALRAALTPGDPR